MIIEQTVNMHKLNEGDCHDDDDRFTADSDDGSFVAIALVSMRLKNLLPMWYFMPFSDLKSLSQRLHIVTIMHLHLSAC